VLAIRRLLFRFLRIPYLSSLLPSQLLSRMLRKGGRLASAGHLLGLLLYGRDPDVRRLLGFARALRRRGIFPEAQMLQDCFVLSLSDGSPRMFVDLGACFPRKYSNTFLLQTYFEWGGTLVEANESLIGALRSREAPNVEVLCAAVGDSRRTELFVEFGPLSSLESSKGLDMYSRMRSKRSMDVANMSKVEVITFDGLLGETSAEYLNGYLSIDIEGSDLAVLETIDFRRFEFRFLTIEHNYDFEVLQAFDRIMLKSGYRRAAKRWSSIDAWYVRS